MEQGFSYHKMTQDETRRKKKQGNGKTRGWKLLNVKHLMWQIREETRKGMETSAGRIIRSTFLT